MYEESDKFTFSLYFNAPDTYIDAAYSPYRVIDYQHDYKKTLIFYKDELDYLLEIFFPKRPEFLNDKEKLRTARSELRSVCAIRNSEGKTIMWFSYDEDAPFMLLNGHLAKNDLFLMQRIKGMFTAPEEPEVLEAPEIPEDGDAPIYYSPFVQ